MSRMSAASLQSLALSRSALAEIILLSTSLFVFDTLLRLSLKNGERWRSFISKWSTQMPHCYDSFRTKFSIFQLTSIRFVSMSCRLQVDQGGTYSPQTVLRVTKVSCMMLAKISFTTQVALKASMILKNRTVSMAMLMLSLVYTVCLCMSTTLVFKDIGLMASTKGVKQLRPGLHTFLNLPNLSIRPMVDVSTLLQEQHKVPQIPPKQVRQFSYADEPCYDIVEVYNPTRVLFILIVCIQQDNKITSRIASEVFKIPFHIINQMSRKQRDLHAGQDAKKDMGTLQRRPIYMDNFVVQSRAFLETIDLDRLIQKPTGEEKYIEDKKDVIINGVNYFEDEIIYHKDAEVLTDCVAVRGDCFYLKKGEKIKIRSVICEYAEVFHRGFKGYFPCSFFNIAKH